MHANNNTGNKGEAEQMPSTDIILESLLDGVLIVARDGRVLYANKSAEQLFDRTSSQLLEQNFGFPVTPYEVQEIHVVRKDNFLTVQMLASVIQWKGQEVFLVSLRDITELKKITLELDAERKELQKTSEENAQYASLASHDLKEPVRKILFFSDGLLYKDPGCLSNDTREQVRKIKSAAERMQLLITGIAEFSNLSRDRTAFTPTDLNGVVNDVLTDLELVVAEKKAVIQVHPLPVIEAIPVQMHQLFLNLISNAIKYTKPGAAPHIVIRADASQEDLPRFMISDNGIGFDNKFAERIFKPYERLHTYQYDGSGIGLAICKKIVEVHGGCIEVSSKPGSGSTFRFSLLKNHNDGNPG